MMNDQRQLLGQLEEALFQVRVARRYHNKRRSVLEAGHKIAAATAVIAGSGAAAALLSVGPGGFFFPALAFLSALLSALSLVFGWNTAAVKHSELRRRYMDLEREMVAVGDIDQWGLNRFRQELRSIEANEPPPLTSVWAAAYNEQSIAERLDNGRLYDIGWHHKFFGSVFNIEPRFSSARTKPAVVQERPPAVERDSR